MNLCYKLGKIFLIDIKNKYIKTPPNKIFVVKVVRRKEKRFVDLAASRGELIEVSIEAVFEPMVQGYIIFPAIIGIIQRLANSVTVTEDGTVTIDFQLKGIETAQIFSISVSMVRVPAVLNCSSVS